MNPSPPSLLALVMSACSSSSQPTVPPGPCDAWMDTSLSADAVSEISPGDSVTVRVRVRNTGEREGAEVVQVYVAYPETLGEPPKQLRAFEKVTLDAGGSQMVELTLGERALAVWDSEADEWVVNPGNYRLLVGSSSVDTPLEATVTVN